MSRVRTLALALLPTAIAGGFMFVSELGHAEAGGDALGFWPAASDSATGSVVIAQADPRPRARQRVPAPPAPPSTPVPPAPPSPPSPPSASVHGRNGVSITIRNGRIQIDGVADMVSSQLDGVLRALDHMTNVAPDVRERLKGRVRGVRDKIRARLSRLRSVDIDRLGPEIERIGDEIEREMEGIDRDLEQLGNNLAKHFADRFGKDFAKDIARSFGPGFPGADNSDGDDHDVDDDDDDDDDAVVPPHNDDLPDVQDRIAALGTLKLTPDQKQKLAKLRVESEQKIIEARRELDQLSTRLHTSLGDSATRETEIERQIDEISQKEAMIRKTRILTWIKVRSMLREDQRKLVEAAVKKRP